MEWRMMEEGWPRAAEPCSGAPRQHGRVSDAREVIEVQPRHAGRREDGCKVSGALELVQGGPMEGCPQQWPSAALSTWWQENPKLKLGCAHFKAGWGRAARGLNDETMDALNQIEVNSPWLIMRVRL